MAVRLADLAAKGGHRVTLGSRSPKRTESIAGKLCTTGNVHGGSYDDDVACDIVLPAIFIRDGAFEQLPPVADAVKGKIVVDDLHPFKDRYDDLLLAWDNRAAEKLQARWPERTLGAQLNWPVREGHATAKIEHGPL